MGDVTSSVTVSPSRNDLGVGLIIQLNLMIDCKIGLYVCREEKTEQLMDSKHEVERLDQELQRAKQEVSSL